MWHIVVRLERLLCSESRGSHHLALISAPRPRAWHTPPQWLDCQRCYWDSSIARRGHWPANKLIGSPFPTVPSVLSIKRLSKLTAVLWWKWMSKQFKMFFSPAHAAPISSEPGSQLPRRYRCPWKSHCRLILCYCSTLSGINSESGQKESFIYNTIHMTDI